MKKNSTLSRILDKSNLIKNLIAQVARDLESQQETADIARQECDNLIDDVLKLKDMLPSGKKTKQRKGA